MREYRVRAVWDAEAEVWVASSDDIPGLATEAATAEELETKLRIMIPELLVANGLLERHDGRPGIPFYLLTQQEKRLIA